MAVHPFAKSRGQVGECAEIGDVVGAAFPDDPACDAFGERSDVAKGLLGPRAAPSRRPHRLVVANRVNADFLAAKETLARVEDGLEHWRRIRDGFADRAQHLGRGLLLLERLLRFAEQPRVLDRDQRLIAEGLGLGDFFGAEIVRPSSHQGEHADAFALAQQRQVNRRIGADEVLDHALVRGHVDQRPIGQVQHGLAENCARRNIGVRIDRNPRGGDEVGKQALRIGAGRRREGVAIAKQCDREVALEHPRGGQNDSFEHRPRVGRRLADDPQDFGRRSLPLQRLLRLVEQSRVLDRDDGLIGKGAEQLHVVHGESARLLARDADHADGAIVARQRREQHAAIAAQSRQLPDDRRHPRFRLGVDELLGFAVANQHERREFGDRPRERRLEGFVRRGVRRGERDQMERIANEADHRGREPAEQPVGARRDGVKHRLHVGG